MKLVMEFYMCLHTISLNFEIVFLEFLWEIAFGVIQAII